MKKVIALWNKLDITTRLSIACIGLYMFLYLWLDIIEAITGVSF